MTIIRRAAGSAHVHENHESGFVPVSGDQVELWTGDELELVMRPELEDRVR